jgi:effector-binding domain-containing protein
MKILKIIGGIIAAIALGIIVLGMIGPKQVHLERSIEIDAPADFVFEHANSFEKNMLWSPWEKKDPNMTKTVEGIDGTVGAIYSWKGNDQVGEGSQKIMEITENKMVTELNLMSVAQVTFSVNETDGKTMATWAYDETPGFLFRAIYMLGSAEDFIGPDFEQGMENLKMLVETNKASKTNFKGFEINQEELASKTYIGHREVVTWAAMGDWFDQQYETLFAAVEKAGTQAIGAPSAIYYMWDEANQQADVMACIPTAEGTTLDKMNAETVAGKAIVIEYFGSYEGSANAHEALEEYMQWHGVEFGGLAIEEYITDPKTEPDTAKWHTRIMYTVK